MQQNIKNGILIIYGNEKTAKIGGKALVDLILHNKQKKQWLLVEISISLYK